MQNGKLLSYLGSRLVKFFLCIFINFTDTHETGESFFFIFFILTFFTYSRRNSGSRKGRCSLTVTFLQCQCLNWLMIDQGNLRKSKPTKPQKPSKKETTIERGNPCDDSEIPEWLQEFKENLMDDEIPVHGDSHASSSHEVSSEPVFKRREDLG